MQIGLEEQQSADTHRAPITPAKAFSKDTIPEGPMFGVAMGAFPPAFWRFVSAILVLPQCVVLWQ